MYIKRKPGIRHPLRFEFLRRYWDYNGGNQKSPYICIVESDVLFNHKFFSNFLEANVNDLIAVQHFWGHNSFESVNFGIICTHDGASKWTRLYTYALWHILKLQSRRFLFFNQLFQLAPSSLVLGLDEYHGCTRYSPDCNYIHFTRPKLQTMEAALENF